MRKLANKKQKHKKAVKCVYLSIRRPVRGESKSQSLYSSTQDGELLKHENVINRAKKSLDTSNQHSLMTCREQYLKKRINEFQ